MKLLRSSNLDRAKWSKKKLLVIFLIVLKLQSEKDEQSLNW